MKTCISRIGAVGLLALLPLAVVAPAGAAPAAIDLRIEGKRSTVYEGPVTTDGHVVRPSSGDDHRCDGTNGGANPSPGPTPTSALDDAASDNGFTWDGKYFDDFGDYLVSRIGSESPDPSSEFWGIFVNSTATSAGGCQVIVKPRDQVLWAIVPFDAQTVLRLDGPSSGRTGTPFTVKVTDGADGSAVEGARVGGATTAADGTARLSYSQPGIYKLKAERAQSVRSNALSVCIDPPGAPPCTSTDRAAPAVTLRLADLVSDFSTSRTFDLDWSASDGGGSGITSYGVAVRRVEAGGAPRPFTTLVERTNLTRASFRGASGAAYDFRVTATDRAGNVSGGANDTLVVPVDDRDRKLIRFSGGWSRLKRKGAWGRFVRRAYRRGSSVRMRVEGRRVALIGRRLRRGGRVRLSIAGRSKVLSVRGKGRHRGLLYRSAPLPKGRHTLRLTALGGGPVELDAVAVLP